MKRLLRFLFIWVGAWGAPFLFWEDIPIVKKICLLPEYILGIGFLVLVGFFVEDRRKKTERDAYRRGYPSGKAGALDAPAEPGAERKSQAVIVVHAPGAVPGGGSRFVVLIDGWRVGEAQPWLATEFAVEPGEHTVAVSMAWFRSRPVPVLTRPGSRTELKIGGSFGFILLKLFLPILVCVVAVPLILGGLRWAGAFADPSPRWFLAISVAVFAGYFLPASLLIRDYWAVFTLEPVNASSRSRITSRSSGPTAGPGC